MDLTLLLSAVATAVSVSLLVDAIATYRRWREVVADRHAAQREAEYERRLLAEFDMRVRTRLLLDGAVTTVRIAEPRAATYDPPGHVGSDGTYRSTPGHVGVDWKPGGIVRGPSGRH